MHLLLCQQLLKILITERVSPVPPDESFDDTDILLPNLITATLNLLNSFTCLFKKRFIVFIVDSLYN